MAQDICTKDDVKARMGNALGALLTDTRVDELLDGTATALGLIEQYSRWFEDRVGVEFDETSGTVEISGDGTGYLIVPREYTPIISISAICSGAADLAGDSWEVEDAAAGVVRRSSNVNDAYATRLDLPRWSIGVKNISVTLTYGYAAIPAAVRGAVAELCTIQLLLLDASERDGDVTSRRLGDRTETYGAGGGGRHGRRIVDLRRSVDLVLAEYGAFVEA